MDLNKNIFLRSLFINNNSNNLLLINTFKNINFSTFNFKFFLIRDKTIVISNKSLLLKNFIKSILCFSNKKIFYCELDLIGLGYRISIKNKVIRLSLGFSHIIFVLLPDSIFFLKRKNKVLVYGFNKLNLSFFISKLLRFKKLNVYKLKGLKKKYDTFKLKPGKRTK
jgi:large subunit ribosomal protein L6